MAHRLPRLARRPKPDATTLGLIVCAVLVWVVAGYFAISGRRGVFGGDPVASASAPTGEAPPEPASASAVPSLAAPPAVKDVSACVAQLFPEKSFRDPPDFAFLCKEANPVKGGSEVKEQVVKGAGGATSLAMRKWVQLAWYEMMAYSLLRARCCPSVPPLEWRFELSCPVDEPLLRFEKAVKARDNDAIDEVLLDYGEEIRCLSRFGQAPNFNQGAPPGSGVEIVMELLERAGVRKRE